MIGAGFLLQAGALPENGEGSEIPSDLPSPAGLPAFFIILQQIV